MTRSSAVPLAAAGFEARVRESFARQAAMIEFKLNCLAPAAGERLRLIGRVRKPGRTIVVAEGEAIVVAADGSEKLVATMTATEMTIRGRDGVVD